MHRSSSPFATPHSAATIDRMPARLTARRLPVVGRPDREQRAPCARPRTRRLDRPAVSLALERFHGGKPLVEPLGNRSPAYLAAKRVFDIVGAFGLMVLLSPLMVTALAVLSFTTHGRPLFFQERIGFCGRRFWMIKFRTMRQDAERSQHVVANEQDGPIFKNRRDPRITRIGRFLRSSSIDEMPQLFNVLIGSMSLVGPRPPVAKEVVEYQPWQRRRLAVKPGLTCLWQVSGRSEIQFEEWVRMDLWYLRNQNLRTDLKLLVRTPASVISGRGAY
jgi:lipopolysaccharide/colanic/teichoic acid biosynthesis glycosyltransferase